MLALIPYRQIGEGGFACADDGAPLLAMTVTGQDTVPVGEAVARIPDRPLTLSGGHFDVSDDDYAEIVRRVVKEAIGEGEGANFVIKRSFVADIGDYTAHSALAFFRRLLAVEHGERLGAASRGHGTDVAQREQQRERLAHRRVVVDDEDAPHRAIIRSQRSRITAAGGSAAARSAGPSTASWPSSQSAIPPTGR